jgi:SAM-dependent methyltransferase
MPSWNTKSAQFKRLWGYSIGFYGVWIAHVGRRTGLFEAIAQYPSTPKELAMRAKFNVDAVETWCSSAIALGFLKSKRSKLYLQPGMQEILLDKKSPNYLGGQFSYLALRSLDYGRIEDTIRSGQTREMSLTFDAIVEATDWDHNAFLSAIKCGRNRKLDALLSRECRVLDVGCGTGTFIGKLMQIYPLCSFVGVEPSGEAAKEAMRRARGKPVEILCETGERMKFDKEFDLVYLGESLYAASDKRSVISNCHRALKNGGAIAIVEGLLPEVGTSDESRLIQGMQLDFLLQGYRFMTRKEVNRLLKDAGFTKITFEDFGGSLYLITAWAR